MQKKRVGGVLDSLSLPFDSQKSFKDEVALVLVGTDTTENELATASPGHYTNITVHQDLEMPTLSLLRYLANSVTPGSVSADGQFYEDPSVPLLLAFLLRTLPLPMSCVWTCE